MCWKGVADERVRSACGADVWYLQREAYRYTCGVTYSLGDVVGLVVAAYSLLDEVHGHGYDHVYVIEKAGGE